jgi:hypothetical protein
MTRPGYRRGVPTGPRGGDLARKAVVVGAVLAAAVVFLATLTVVWAPSEDGTGPASFLAPLLAKKGGSKGSDSDDDSGSGESKHKHGSKKDGSKKDGSKKDGSSKDGSKKDGSKKDGSSKEKDGSSKDGSSNGSSESGSDGSSSSSSSSDGSSSGAGPTGSGGSGSGTGAGTGAGERNGPMVNISCTKEVRDEAGLRDALASAGPNDVICVKGSLGRASTPSPSGSPATPTPSVLPPVGPPAPHNGPISTCGPGGTCRQTNRTSGPSAEGGSGGSSGTTKNRSLGSPPAEGSGGRMSMDPALTGFTGPPGATTPKQENCTKQVDGAGLAQAVGAAAPGDRICVTGNSPNRLEITKGGSDQAPITVVGDGNASVKGITVKTNNVVVDGFQVVGAQAPGIELTGNNLTAQNNTVKHPTGGDFDGMRFFGNNIRILHNTITDINPDGGKAHADCMQTFTNGRPSSEHVLIDGNRCEKIANICLMAEGPGDVGDGGGGDGTSADWTFSNNFCQFGAGQGVMVEAVQNVTIRNNQFEGRSSKAIGLDIGSTGATIAANLLGQGIDHEVGMDAKSRQGYRGPAPQGGP